MKKVIFVCLFFMITTSLFGTTELVEIENEANAGNDANALSLLQAYQKDHLEPWQQDRIIYNMGTVLLQEGKYEDALSYFRSVTTTTDTFLKPFVLINAAIALWGDVKASLPLNQFSTYIQAINKLKTALFYLHAVPEDLFPQVIKLKSTIKPVLGDLLKQKSNMILSYATDKEKLFELAIGMDRLLKQLDGFEQAKRESFMQMAHQQQLSWDPLWKSLLNINELMPKAHSQYLSGMENFLSGNIDVSMREFKSAKVHLISLLKSLYGNERGTDLLVSLQSQYQFILEQDLLPSSTIEKMITEQNLLESVYPDIKQSTQYLNQAIKALEENTRLKGRFFLNAAYENVLRLLREKGAADPAKLLQFLIEDQSYTMELSSMAEGIDDASTLEVLQDAQKRVNQAAKAFLPKVYEYQKGLYHKYNKDKDLRCQCQPWDQVLPLFNEGFDFAKLSENALIDKIISKSLAFQKMSLQNWEKALAALNQEPEPVKEKDEKLEVKESLRLLQQMEHDDRQPRKESQAIRGNKPW